MLHMKNPLPLGKFFAGCRVQLCIQNQPRITEAVEKNRLIVHFRPMFAPEKTGRIRQFVPCPCCGRVLYVNLDMDDGRSIVCMGYDLAIAVP